MSEDWKKTTAFQKLEETAFKNGKKKDLRHCWSVILTSVLVKVLECPILEAIFIYTMVSSQHRFSKDKSCLTNLISSYDETTFRIDAGEQRISPTLTSARLLILSVTASSKANSGDVDWMSGQELAE
ncbi:hypothetical protein DUI87_00787 [Hirundo rustica rustica]|uniref:Uncharacterized protein n=1 Tax=Hirundo rustica rustica TaxID=333673 RepID=A0A3M0LB38_HIRRU|nr:hypothetical protein DUI87_00787 [Hirundo rustica rustica]